MRLVARCLRPGRGAYLSLAAAALLTPSSFALPDKTVIEIGPGPRAITAEEQALVPDPSKGAEHGIILVDETDRDETGGTDSEVWHHFRAKIFTPEARDLANIEIPYASGAGIKKWWGWTLLPDGTLRELGREELKAQEVVRAGGERLAVLKAVLPGVVPGCVLDYGYLLWDPGHYRSLRVDLQRSWPTREFRYWWTPWGGSAASFRVARSEGLSVNVTRDSRAVLVAGRNLPAVVEEPWMPPAKELRASATFYYRSAADSPEEYWNLEAKRLNRLATSFAKEKPIRDAIASIPFPPDGDLKARLNAAYDWIASNVKNTSFRTAEEAEADTEEEGGALRKTAKDVLEARQGTGRQLDYLFLGIARALGAEADLVLATDRTDHYLDQALLTTAQFDWSLVAVRAPGEPVEKAVFVDNGSGLPYGELPWWITGTNALVATPKGARVVMIWPSDPRKNLSEAKTEISIGPDGTAKVRWTRTDSGQPGLSERLRLRTLTPEQQRKELDESCGARGSFEVSRAEAPRLKEITAGFRLECEGTLMDTNFHPGLSGYSFGFLGDWIEPVPELTAPSRVHPVVFHYPRIDQNVIDIAAPEGFTPVAAPPVIPLESPYGHYALFISATPAGYHVERVFSLTSLGVPAKEYEALRSFLTAVHRADRTYLEFQRAGATR